MEFKIPLLPNGISALEWSSDNQLAICTNSRTTIVCPELTGAASRQSLPALPFDEKFAPGPLAIDCGEAIQEAKWSQLDGRTGCLLLALTTRGRAFVFSKLASEWENVWIF